MGLSLLQQHLFSFFNLVKVSSEESALEICEENLNESFSFEQLTREISMMNKIIKNYDLEIVETIDEINCKKLFVLINTSDNSVTQKCKFYHDDTSQLFSKIVKYCVLSEKGYLSEAYCLNLANEVKVSKVCQTQSILEKLINDKWLVSWNNNISLGMRTVAELEQNIKQTYPDDVKNCNFCQLIVIQGYICAGCKIKCHYNCLIKYIKLSKSDFTCPKCKEIWSDLTSDLPPEVYEMCEKVPIKTCPPKKKKRMLVLDSD